MKQYMVYSCDGGDVLSLVEADSAEEALDVAKFEARARLTEHGLSAVHIARLLHQWNRSYVMEVSQ